MEERLEITRNKRFRYGLLLTWIPLLFFLVPSAIGIIRAVVKISGEKATGLAAVAGGVDEVAATFGLIIIFASEIVGSVLLVKTASRDHPARAAVAIVSVVCSGLLLLILGLFLWFAIVHHWR